MSCLCEIIFEAKSVSVVDVAFGFATPAPGVSVSPAAFVARVLFTFVDGVAFGFVAFMLGNVRHFVASARILRLQEELRR